MGPFSPLPRKKAAPILFAVTAALAAAAGCGNVAGEAPTFVHAFRLKVTSDDGRPLAGADVTAGASRTARTNEAGEALLELRGHEGDRYTLIVTCPKDYQARGAPLVVTLHQSRDTTRRPTYEILCTPLRRTAVVAVRAENGANLPVVYLGEEVARTDDAGAANVLVHVPPGEPFRLTVDTSGPGKELLRPRNPSIELSVGDNDDLLLFDAKLTVVEPPRPPVRRGGPARPTRL